MKKPGRKDVGTCTSGTCPRAYFRVPLLTVLVLVLAACSPPSSRDAGRMALQLPIGDPMIKVAADEAAPGISFLSWDTEGGEKAATNLLRAGSAVRVQFLSDGAWTDAKMVDRRGESGGVCTAR